MEGVSMEGDFMDSGDFGDFMEVDSASMEVDFLVTDFMEVDFMAAHSAEVDLVLAPDYS
jgi:hypothetical protein